MNDIYNIFLFTIDQVKDLCWCHTYHSSSVIIRNNAFLRLSPTKDTTSRALTSEAEMTHTIRSRGNNAWVDLLNPANGANARRVGMRAAYATEIAGSKRRRPCMGLEHEKARLALRGPLRTCRVTLPPRGLCTGACMRISPDLVPTHT